MIAQPFDYASPATLDEALQLVAAGAKPLAGGMSLIPMMKLRLAAPEKVVDLGRIAGLRGIRIDGSQVRIGALTTHFEIESSAEIRRACPLLGETAGNIGDVQVRNAGTIGGSVAHADPAADYPAALLALEARVRLVKAGGEREVAVGDFLLDMFTTSAEPDELIAEVIVPIEQPGTGVNYQKLLQPASGFAIVGVAARLRKASDGKLAFARIGITGLASHAFRATSAERALEGSTGSEADITAAIGGIGEGVESNSDIHASAAYRRQMARVYAGRAIRAALARIA
jgi:carbon-monoxide dehydrogenase medium subunit